MKATNLERPGTVKTDNDISGRGLLEVSVYVPSSSFHDQLDSVCDYSALYPLHVN